MSNVRSMYINFSFLLLYCQFNLFFDALMRWRLQNYLKLFGALRKVLWTYAIKMEVEKRGSKGGFFQLFDWNVKSRKKLFSGRSELTESSKQGKENVNGSALSRLQQVNGLENEFGPNARRDIDYHYASSASGDSECGTKAPGVVARLMGLDSLPTSNVSEPYLTPFNESHSFRDSHYLGIPSFQSEHDILVFDNIRNKVDGFTRNPMEPRLQKLRSRPIERFQSEVLPPKSAKPISITHHRLLSPIKSPGFIPPKNAAYVMEAAAKIIEHSPRSTPKGKSLALGSSSAPLRIQDLKEKMEAAQKSSPMAVVTQKVKEHNSVKNTKKQLSGRGQGRSEDAHSIKGTGESKRNGSQKLKSKENSVSSAVQVKGNIQKKEELIPAGNRSSEKQKEHNEIKSNCVGRNQSNAPKRVEKRSSPSQPSDALRQNHQKQNCASNRMEGNYKSSVSQQKDRKDMPINYINGRARKTVNKIVVNNVVSSRKTNSVTNDAGKEFSSSRVNTPVKKKQPIKGNIQSDRTLAESVLMAKDERSVKCNVSIEGNTEWDAFDRNNGLDVVSFTFTSPIKKSGAALSSSSKTLEVARSVSPISNPSDHQSDFKSSGASSSARNIIGRDALSAILEHKLKELTSRVVTSQQELLEAGSFSSIANSYQNTGPTVNLVNKDDLYVGKRESQNDFDCPFFDKLWLKEVKEQQGLQDKQDYSNNSNTEHESYLNISRSSPASSLEPSFSGASCDTLDGDRSFSNDVESDEVTDWSSARKSHPMEGDVELSDTASSVSVGTISRHILSTLYPSKNLKESSPWQLQYIRDMISNAELLLEEFALGQAHKIVPPDLFDQLENQYMESNKNPEEFFRLERRVVFDCVCECLELRCRQFFAGSCRAWTKQTMLFRRKEWLAEELYREISSWSDMDELMVDEVVDKDMSTNDGRWIEFEIEAFEEGVEIENKILTSLFDELIDDFLF
ncbi:Hypothetical predicted protein [Olea europaea subsp. europaea]|uniref:DUF4378 domain-containing protein n=2 Tax=Olea europaea subsp. europaea TaxID=158383 RepID=A0A8S0SZB4_OLEEU|nr:Hypothetical predicted protein [Olea europaea subsp. europaea]